MEFLLREQILQTFSRTNLLANVSRSRIVSGSGHTVELTDLPSSDEEDHPRRSIVDNQQEAWTRNTVFTNHRRSQEQHQSNKSKASFENVGQRLY